VIDLGYTAKCDTFPDCKGYLEKWGTWCFDHEQAPLAIVSLWYDYRPKLDRKSRQMITKARKHFFYQVFNYNYHLDEIYQINTSTPSRQGKPMSPAYLTRPTAMSRPYDLCNDNHRYVFIGGFDENSTLKAYCALAVVGEIGILNTIIGHCDSLSYGVMNGLIDYIVSYLKTTTGAKYLNYLDLINCGPGLKAFKESVGFRSMSCNFEY
jgi:hypothetical protein